MNVYVKYGLVAGAIGAGTYAVVRGYRALSTGEPVTALLTEPVNKLAELGQLGVTAVSGGIRERWAANNGALPTRLREAERTNYPQANGQPAPAPTGDLNGFIAYAQSTLGITNSLAACYAVLMSIESGGHNRGYACYNYNGYGIQWYRHNEPIAAVLRGTSTAPKAFEAYDNWEESIRRLDSLISSRYAPARTAGTTGNLRAFVNALGAGYNTNYRTQRSQDAFVARARLHINRGQLPANLLAL